MGNCKTYNITPDSIPDLLEIFRLSQIGGTTFTIRQAIWADRLHHAMSTHPNGDRCEELHRWAVKYASEERISQVLEKQMDTRTLDSELAFRGNNRSISSLLLNLSEKLGSIPSTWGLLDRYKAVLDGLTENLGSQETREVVFGRRQGADSDEVQELRNLIRSYEPKSPIDGAFQQDWEDALILIFRLITPTDRWKNLADTDRENVFQQMVDRPNRICDPWIEIMIQEELNDLGLRQTISIAFGEEGAFDD